MNNIRRAAGAGHRRPPFFLTVRRLVAGVCVLTWVDLRKRLACSCYVFVCFAASSGERIGVNFVGFARRFEKHVYIRAFSGYEFMFLCLPRGAGRGPRIII